MTIEIKALNIGRVRKAELDLREGALNALVGHNRAGKTTLLNAIRATACRLPRIYDVTKADATALVTEGQPSGGVMIERAGSSITLEWPGGQPVEKGSGAVTAKALAAGLVDPLKLATADWLGFLSRLLPDEYRITQEIIAARLVELGLPQQEATSRAQQVAQGPMTWEALETHYADAAKAYRRDWERITGERWGDTKVVGWRPAGFDPALEDKDAAVLRAEITAARDKVVAAQVSGAAGEAARLSSERAELTARVAQLRRSIAAGAPDRGPHLTVKCTACGHPNHVQPVIYETGEAVLEPWSEPTAKEQKAEAKRVADLEAEITAAEQKIAALAKAIEQARAPRELPPEAVQASALADTLQAQLDSILKVVAARQASDKWRVAREVAKAASVSGLRREYVARGVAEQINPMLLIWSVELGLFEQGVQVAIDTDHADMPVLVGGYHPARYAYNDEDNSTAARVRWLIQIVAAMMDGSDLVCLDGGDIVEPVYRSALAESVKMSGITALLAMTSDDPAQAARTLADLPGIGGVHVIDDAGEAAHA